MDQQFADRLAEENLPQNYDDLISQIKKTFPQYFFYGVVDPAQGIGFTSANVQGFRIAGMIAEMCKQNPMMLAMIVSQMNNPDVQGANVSHIIPPKDALFDDIIEVKE